MPPRGLNLTYPEHMPRSGGDAAPRDYITTGTWPNAALGDDAPASAIYAQAFVRNLNRVIAERGNPSIREVGRQASVTRHTLDRALDGRNMPDFGAIARLEEWAQADLWPGPEIRRRAHLTHPSPTPKRAKDR